LDDRSVLRAECTGMGGIILWYVWKLRDQDQEVDVVEARGFWT
jgi:hypothetical protein